MSLALDAIGLARQAKPTLLDAGKFERALADARRTAGRPEGEPLQPAPEQDDSDAAGNIARWFGRFTREQLFGFEMTEEDGRRVLDAGDGNDHVTITQTADGRLRVKNEGAIFSVWLSPEDASQVEIRGGRGDDRIEVVAGGDPRVDPPGEPSGLTLDGGDGADTVIGGNGADLLRGGVGEDRLEGGGGTDILRGEAGADRLYGQGGLDVILGGDGRDYIDGGEGLDLLAGGAATDTYNQTYRTDGGHRDLISDEGFNVSLI